MRRCILTLLSVVIVALVLSPANVYAKAATCADKTLLNDLAADLNDMVQKIGEVTAFMKDSSNSNASVQLKIADEVSYFIGIRHKYEDYKTTSGCDAIRINAVEYFGNVEDAMFYNLAGMAFPSQSQYGSLLDDATKRASQFNGNFTTFMGQSNSAPAATSQSSASSGNPLTFSGTGNKVLASFTLPKGIYTISVTTKEAFALYIQSLDESACKSSPGIINEVNTDGDMSISAQALYTVSSDCKVILSTQNSSNAWSMTIEPAQ